MAEQLPFADRCGQGFFNGPAELIDSCFECTIGNSLFAGPHHHALSFTKSSDHVVSAHVVHLFHPRRPSAILWRIIAVSVNAVDAVLRRWARPHVGVESGEVIFPAVADAYAASAIGRISISAREGAAADYVTPHRILWHSDQSMCGVRFRPALISVTTTGSCVAGSEVASKHQCFVSTSALANPLDAVLGIFSASNDGEKREGLTCMVDAFCHGILRQILNRMKSAAGSSESAFRPLRLATKVL